MGLVLRRSAQIGWPGETVMVLPPTVIVSGLGGIATIENDASAPAAFNWLLR